MQKALGLIETRGLTASITAADAAVKSANVTLLGYEYARGAGLTTIKVEGDVGAVRAAVDAGSKAASMVGKVIAAHVIPRPADSLDAVCVRNERMKGGVSGSRVQSNLSKPQPVEKKVEVKVEEKVEDNATVVENPEMHEEKKSESKKSDKKGGKK